MTITTYTIQNENKIQIQSDWPTSQASSMLLYKFKHNLTNSLPIINTKSVTILNSRGDRVGSLVALKTHVCLYSQYSVRNQKLLFFSVRVYGVVLLMRHRSILRSDAFPATTIGPDGNRTQELLLIIPALEGYICAVK